MYANVHFRERNASGQATDEPFTAADFLGRGDRQARSLKALRDNAAVRRANTTLGRMKKGDPPGQDVPEWARGEYHG